MAFAMPTGTRIRYDIPAPQLAEWITGYAIYISDGRDPMVNWYLPAPAILSILLDAGPLSASIRNRSFPDVDAVSLWGPTSHAFRTVTHGGISVGIGLTARGWIALTGRSAVPFLNRVVPAATLVDGPAMAQLAAALRALDDDAAIAPLLDEMLPAMFAHGHAGHPLVGAMEAAVLAPGPLSVDELAKRIGLDVRTLRVQALRCFGMPSKKLLSRARFIRSYAAWLMLGEPPSYAGIDDGYFDAAHFLRDAAAYLGTTPLRFARRETSFLRASLSARAAVIGAPAHTLHAVRRPDGASVAEPE